MARAVPAIGLLIRLGAAGIWLVAGAAKVGELQHFQAQVHAYHVVPAGLEAPFAYALPFVELAVGFYLAIGLLVRPAALVGSALMVLFVIALGQAWARGLSIDCGCFGPLAKEPVGPGTVLRDAALGLPGLVMAVWPARLLSLDARLLGKRDEFAERWTPAHGRRAPVEAAKPS